MPFIYERTIHFPDTDAAGVVFFARFYSICHEAYEEALSASGMELHTFFSDSGTMIPVARIQAEYKRPLMCGDKILVQVLPERLSENSFAVNYEITKPSNAGKLVAKLRTEHVCINSGTRERQALPAPLSAWISAH